MNSKQNNNFKSFSTFLSNLSPLEFTTIGCLVGLIITEQLNSNEQNSIGNFFELVGQVILTAQAQSSINSSSPSSSDFNNFKNQTNSSINNIFKEISKLKNRL